jgi:hypothetical protein
LSLILEALKKLDREKQAPERGFLVVGAVPWPAPRARRWWPAVLALGVVVVLALVAWLAWPRGAPEAPRAVAPPATIAAAAPAMPPVATAKSAPASVPANAPPETATRPETPMRTEPTPASSSLAIPPAPASPAARPTPAPAKPADAASGGLQLQAIAERDGHPVAIISGRLVREGDRYDGIAILHIGADEVEIELQGQRRTLRF